MHGVDRLADIVAGQLDRFFLIFWIDDPILRFFNCVDKALYRFRIVLDELFREVVEGCSCCFTKSGIRRVEQLNQPGVTRQFVERRVNANDVDIALLVGL
ncbi:hypothetical protein D3C81_1619770 [compost metagenome]